MGLFVLPGFYTLFGTRWSGIPIRKLSNPYLGG